MNLWSALVAIVAIWGVVEVFRQWSKSRRAAAPGQSGGVSPAELERLEDRIATLERIVTDDKEALRRRFDEL